MGGVGFLTGANLILGLGIGIGAVEFCKNVFEGQANTGLIGHSWILLLSQWR